MEGGKNERKGKKLEYNEDWRRKEKEGKLKEEKGKLGSNLGGNNLKEGEGMREREKIERM